MSATRSETMQNVFMTIENVLIDAKNLEKIPTTAHLAVRENRPTAFIETCSLRSPNCKNFLISIAGNCPLRTEMICCIRTVARIINTIFLQNEMNTRPRFAKIVPMGVLKSCVRTINEILNATIMNVLMITRIVNAQKNARNFTVIKNEINSAIL
jgi:hypothetical protein